MAGLGEIEGLTASPVQTNMAFVAIDDEKISVLTEHLKSRDILVGSYCPGELRLVTHLDVSTEDIETVVGAVRKYFSK